MYWPSCGSGPLEGKAPRSYQAQQSRTERREDLTSEASCFQSLSCGALSYSGTHWALSNFTVQAVFEKKSAQTYLLSPEADQKEPQQGQEFSPQQSEVQTH